MSKKLTHLTIIPSLCMHMNMLEWRLCMKFNSDMFTFCVFCVVFVI